MNNDRMEGAWKEFKGKVKEQWGKLTDDEVDEAEGKWDRLSGMIQKKYGQSKDEVELEVRKFREENERPITTDRTL